MKADQMQPQAWHQCSQPRHELHSGTGCRILGSVARALVRSLESRGRAAGCSELASDAVLGNRTSHALHQALGFDETGRVVYFRKALD